MGMIATVQDRFYRWTGRTELAEAVRAEREMVSHLTESIATLEQQMHEPGWQRLTANGEQEFTRDGLRQITSACRIMAMKNPLIKRGVSLRTAYVWGQGVEITARDRKINDVVQQFIDDNLTTFTGSTAREELEKAVETDGNVFLALFTTPATGRVRVRAIPWDEITDILTNPEDSAEPWYYRREWWQDTIDPTTGGIITKRRSAYYPALGYDPDKRPRYLNIAYLRDSEPAEIFWDAPVYHVKVNGQLGRKWGVPDVYAAIDWAMAYKEFLSDWAQLIRSLSRFAWRLTSPGSKQAQAKARLTQPPSVNPLTGEYQHTGATAITAPGQTIEAIPKSGATIDSESGRPLAAMVAAALDLPVTMLLGDPGVTGARATAETLDQPTELAMQARRQLWTQAINAILQYVIRVSVVSPGGRLRGRVYRDGFDVENVKVYGRKDTTIDISWPDLDEVDAKTVVEAITLADGTGHLPPLVVIRLLLEALGVTDVDAILDKLTGPDGEYQPPEGSADAAGAAAADAFSRGEDPSALLNGPTGREDPEPSAPPRPGE